MHSGATATTTPLTDETDLDLNYLADFDKLSTCDCPRDEDFPILISDVTRVFHLTRMITLHLGRLRMTMGTQVTSLTTLSPTLLP